MKRIRELINWIYLNRSGREIAGRLTEVLLGYPLFLLSFLVKRNSRKWAIGGKVGFADNPKYFYLYLAMNRIRDVRYRWIAGNRKEAVRLRSKGIDCSYKWSLKGIWYCLTAGKYIYSCHLTDVNYWTSGGVVGVNLWHGVGIKCIEFKARSGPEKRIYDEKNKMARLFLPHLFRRPDLFLSTSSLMTRHFAECFRISEQQCMRSGYPRCDIFYWSRAELKSFIEKYEGSESLALVQRMETCSKVFIYMPTYRDTQTDFFAASGIDLCCLDTELRNINALLLIKMHPATRMDGELAAAGLTNILFLDSRMDVYPLLPFTDVLITDYSSIYYDYLLMESKSVLLFPFDYEEYIATCRDLAFDFDSYTPGPRVRTFSGLLDAIRNGVVPDFEQRKWVTEQFWENRNRESAGEIYRLLTRIPMSGGRDRSY